MAADNVGRLGSRECSCHASEGMLIMLAAGIGGLVRDSKGSSGSPSRLAAIETR